VRETKRVQVTLGLRLLESLCDRPCVMEIVIVVFKFDTTSFYDVSGVRYDQSMLYEV
jgi:hypothetical protein